MDDEHDALGVQRFVEGPTTFVQVLDPQNARHKDPDSVGEQLQEATTQERHDPNGRLSLPTSSGLLFIRYKQVIHLRADGSYTHVHCKDGLHYLACKGLGEFERELPASLFVRCHHAQVINLVHVTALTSTGGHRAVLDNGDSIAISRRRWHAVVAAMKKLR